MNYYNEAERVTFSIKPSICKEDDTECTLENIYQKESEDWKGQECAGEMLEHWPSGGKPWLAALVSFQAVNTPTEADVEGPRWGNRAWSGKEMRTIGSPSNASRLQHAAEMGKPSGATSSEDILQAQGSKR